MALAEEIEPVPGHIAFARADPAAVHSQAAFLLLLGRRVGHGGSEEDGEMSENVEALGVPRLANAPALQDSVDVPEFARQRQEFDFGDFLGRPAIDRARAVADLVEALYEVPTPEAATSLIEACLHLRNPLVGVAAAVAKTQLGLKVGWPPSPQWSRAPIPSIC